MRVLARKNIFSLPTAPVVVLKPSISFRIAAGHCINRS